MTKTEAIAILEVSKHMATSGRLYNQAIDMAIEALSEPIKEWDENREIIKDILQMMPTAYLLEALGVATFDELMDSERTGEWKTDKVYAGIRFYRCDQCNFRQSEKSRFCPSCGAVMRGKNNAT